MTTSHIEDRDRLLSMSVQPEGTLREALAAIERGAKEIAFVVESDGRVVGTLTDGDIRRAILAGRGLDDTRSDAVMRREFKHVSDGGDHRSRALDAMRVHMVKQVPVLGPGGELTGLHVIEEYIEADPAENWCVILAGGKGTRLRPLTERIPKPMIRVAGRPMLERLVHGVVSAGISRIFLSVNYMKEVIQDYFGDGSKHGCRIEYLEEETPLGTGGPLRLLPEAPQHPVLHLNGDLVGEFNFRDLIRHHEQHRYALTLATGPHSYEVPYGVLDLEDGQVVRVREKPLMTWWINQGVYVVSPELIKLITPDAEFPITRLIEICLTRGLPVGAVEAVGDWQDVGRHQDLRVAQGLSDT